MIIQRFEGVYTAMNYTESSCAQADQAPTFSSRCISDACWHLLAVSWFRIHSSTSHSTLYVHPTSLNHSMVHPWRLARDASHKLTHPRIQSRSSHQLIDIVSLMISLSQSRATLENIELKPYHDALPPAVGSSRMCTCCATVKAVARLARADRHWVVVRDCQGEAGETT